MQRRGVGVTGSRASRIMVLLLMVGCAGGPTRPTVNIGSEGHLWRGMIGRTITPTQLNDGSSCGVAPWC